MATKCCCAMFVNFVMLQASGIILLAAARCRVLPLLLQAEVEVLVPLSWPSDAGEALSLVQLSAPGVSSSEAAEIMEAVNADTELLSTCDVLGLLQFVSQLVAEQQQENGGA